jgi:hypothetical protein
LSYALKLLQRFESLIRRTGRTVSSCCMGVPFVLNEGNLYRFSVVRMFIFISLTKYINHQNMPRLVRMFKHYKTNASTSFKRPTVHLSRLRRIGLVQCHAVVHMDSIRSKALKYVILYFFNVSLP